MEHIAQPRLVPSVLICFFTVINLALTLHEGGVAHVKADNGPHHS